MSLTLRGIQIQGFRGVRGILDVPIGGAFTVICGRNGTGKSTIIDAVEYAISGKLNRFAGVTEKKETIDDYLWWRGDLDAGSNRVSLDFATSEDRRIDVTRAQGDVVESMPPEFFDLGKAPRNAADVLCVTGIIRDETITRFSIDLTESERFQFVREALGLTDWSAFEKLIEGRLGDVRTLKRRYERDYELKRNSLYSAKSELSVAKAAASKGGLSSLDQILAQYAEVTGKAATSISEASRELQRSVSDVRERLSRLRVLSELVIQRDALGNGDVTALDAVEALRNKLGRLEQQEQSYDAQLKQSEERIDELHRRAPHTAAVLELARFGEQVGIQGGHCPLCSSAVTAPEFKRSISALRKGSEKEAQVLETLLRERESVQAQRLLTKTQIDGCKVELGRLAAEAKTRSALADQIRSHTEALEVEPSTKSIDAAVANAANRLQSFEILQAVVLSSQAMDRIFAIEQQISEIEEASAVDAKLVADSSKLEYLVQSAFDVARRTTAELIDERLASLEPLLLELYSRLKPHTEWSEIRYRRRGDVKGMLSFAVGNNLNPRFLYSSGQRRALGLAFLLSVYLARNWTPFETLILDDPIQHIDDYRALHLVETLTAISKLGRQVICAVEDPAIAGLLCRRLATHGSEYGVRLDLGYVPGEGIEIQHKEIIRQSGKHILLSA